ncbi:rho guanine nucleotide exchange factor [Pelomyxa schiedti]|nr:rho guanine nucleotide exchange factor [Pelomyxa schiedti]
MVRITPAVGVGCTPNEQYHHHNHRVGPTTPPAHATTAPSTTNNPHPPPLLQRPTPPRTAAAATTTTTASSSNPQGAARVPQPPHGAPPPLSSLATPSGGGGGGPGPKPPGARPQPAPPVSPPPGTTATGGAKAPPPVACPSCLTALVFGRQTTSTSESQPRGTGGGGGGAEWRRARVSDDNVVALQMRNVTGTGTGTGTAVEVRQGQSDAAAAGYRIVVGDVDDNMPCWVLATAADQREIDDDWLFILDLLVTVFPQCMESPAWSETLPKVSRSLPTSVPSTPSLQQQPASIIPPPPSVSDWYIPPPVAESTATTKGNADLFAEVARWDLKKEGLQQALRPIQDQTMKALEQLYQGYQQKVRAIIATQFDHGVATQVQSDMKKAEQKHLEALKEIMFGRNSLLSQSIEEESKKRKDAYLFSQKVITVQRLVKGWLTRNRYQKLKKTCTIRTRTVQELLVTERTYVDSLAILKKEFSEPLKLNLHTSKPFITAENVNALFSNFEKILVMHQELLGELTARVAKWNVWKTPISDIFNDIMPYMKSYSLYINSYDKAIATLTGLTSSNPEFASWLNMVQAKPELKGKLLNSYLILPVQRIPRYQLLLQEILKNTPTDHFDYAPLTSTLTSIKKVASEINEAKRRAEAQEKVLFIQHALGSQAPDLYQPHRYLCKEGPVMQEKTDELVPVFLILFTDKILITLKKKQENSEKFTLTKLEDWNLAPYCEAIALPAKPMWRFQFGMHIKTRRSEGFFFMEDQQQRDSWLEIISAVAEAIKKNTLSVLLGKLEQSQQLNTSTTIESPPPAPTREPSSRLSVYLDPTSLLSSFIKGAQRSSTNNLTSPAPSTTPPLQSIQSPRQLTTTKVPTEEKRNYKVESMISLYKEVLKLHSEVMSTQVDLSTLFPSYFNKLHPDLTARLRGKADLLLSKLKEMESISTQALELIKEESHFSQFDEQLSKGLEFIDPVRMWVIALCDGTLNTPAGPKLVEQNPKRLMAQLLAWFLETKKLWEVLTQSDLDSICSVP